MTEQEVTQPFVLVVLSKDADAKVMQHTLDTLSYLQVSTEMVRLHDADAGSLAHIQSAICRGVRAVVFGAHYAYTDELCPTTTEALVPVVKVVTGPAPERPVQLALGIAFMGFGADGAIKAALFAARVLARADPALAARLKAFHPLGES